MTLDAPSYACGTASVPLLGRTVGDVLDHAARQWPDEEAVVDVAQNVRWTWRQLRKRALSLAAGLRALGLEPGDRIGLLAPNRAEWLTVQFGTAYAGLILVNINPAYRLRELEYALGKAGCRALIVEPTYKTSDYVAMIRELLPGLDRKAGSQPLSTRLPDLDIVISLGEGSPGVRSYADVAASGDSACRDEIAAIAAALDFDRPVNIQFTSGTTGSPKAATLTHHNIVNNAYLSAGLLGMTPSDRLCVPVPMYHCFGIVLGTLLCAACGATVVFPSTGFDANATLAAIERERCTAIHGVPTMFIAMLDDPDFAGFDLGSLRTGIMAGAPCPVELMQRVIDDMHLAEITIGYGMTETGPLSTQTLPGDTLEHRIRTVGKPLPHTEIKIIDESGSIVPHGVAGELCTRGYCVMQGYWNDPERTTEEIDSAGWIRSGDIARMDDDDYLAIVGRTKDMLIRGGENIYPREIEEFLYTHPKIDQVEVVGVPDPKYGEEIAAWVRLRDGERMTEGELRDFCRGQLAHFKIPRYVRFVDEFPLTVTGKVQKFVMRERMAAELGIALAANG